MTIFGRKIVLFVVLCAAVSGLAPGAIAGGGENLLTYPELKSLYSHARSTTALEARLNRLLTVPFVENRVGASSVAIASRTPLGEYIRVAAWNIERGLEYDALEAAFASEEHFVALLDAKRFPIGSKIRTEIIEQAQRLREADVIILNEVDWGLKRSDYRNIAAELAAKLNFNFAFGVEFVELSPVHLNESPPAEMAEMVKLDPARYRGLHGIAILSRFPLENVRLVPYKHQAYDWFSEEKKSISLIEKARRKLVKEVFLEDVFREVRRGGRTMLMADIVDPHFPAGRATVVGTHIEIRTTPKGRQRQLAELIETIKPIRNPVIVAGDMNTSGQDMAPTDLPRELSKRFGKPEYLLRTGINYLLGLGLVEDLLASTFQLGRSYGDPTVRHVPILMPNEERKFFSMLKDFRFEDRGSFDFRGEAARSSNGLRNTLANSNERDEKGFVTTFRLKRPVKFVGKFKLDWIFVKPVHLFDPSDYQGSYLFAPHFGRTLEIVTTAVENRISDHHPMIVDLPLAEPEISKQKKK